jgi:hypothetical protein
VIPLIVVAVVAIVAMALNTLQQERNARHTSALLAAMAAERYAWARERWDLNTRITAPEVVRAAPPAPPADAPPLEVLQALNVVRPAPVDGAKVDPDDVDESFLVGTGPGEA